MDDELWEYLWRGAFLCEHPDLYFISYGFLPSIYMEIPQEHSLTNRMWLSAHIPIRDLIFLSGQTIQGFARRYNIPLKALYVWCSCGKKGTSCPDFIRIMLARETGLVSELRAKPLDFSPLQRSTADDKHIHRASQCAYCHATSV